MTKQIILALVFLLSSILQAEINDPKLLKILERHNALFLSNVHPNGLIFYKTTGRQIQKNKTFTFETLHKSPFKIRHSFSSEKNDVLLGYDGTVGWRRIEKDGDLFIQSLQGKQLQKLHYEADFYGSIIRAYRGDKTASVAYVSSGIINDRTVDILETIEVDGTKIHYLLNALSGYLERQEIFDADGSIEFSINYGEYRMVEGIPFAFKVEVFSDNELITTAELKEVTVNKEIFDFYFEKPKY